jgi:hypothetical protein
VKISRGCLVLTSDLFALLSRVTYGNQTGPKIVKKALVGITVVFDFLFSFVF